MANVQEQPTALEKRVGRLVAGFEKAWPATANVVLAGQAVAPAQLISQLESILTLLSQVRDAQAAAHEAVVNRQNQSQGWHALLDEVVQAVKAQLGPRSPQLAQFGIAPKKSGATLTPEQKLVAAAKRQATRAARGTKGKRQRSLIVVGGRPTVQILGPDGKPLGGVK